MIKHNLIAIILVIVVTFYGSNLLAADDEDMSSANHLLSTCQPESPEMIYCIGYIEGFGSSLKLQTDAEKNAVCIPKGVTTRQVIMIFKKYAETNPQLLHLHKSIILREAIEKAFPCPN